MTSPATQREHWDRVAEQFPDLFPAVSTQYYRRVEIALLQRTVPSWRGLRVLKLDLWNEAVNTRILHWMQDQGAEVYGLDLSTVTVRRARRNAPSAGPAMHLVQADIRALPFASESFDLVYTMGTIEHVEEYRQVVCDVYRVLKPGSRAIIGVPHFWDPFLRPLIVGVLELFGRYPYSPEKAFSWPELRRVVAAAGFAVEQRAGILAIPGIIRMADTFLFRRGIRLNGLASLSLWPFGVLERRWPWFGRHFGYLAAAVVRKPPRA